MKKLILFSMIAFMFSNVSTAQTAEEIVNNYLENIGGKENLLKIKAIHVKAKSNAQGTEIPIDIYMTSEGKQYIQFELQGKKMVQIAFDGDTAWHTNFMSMKNEKMNNEATENMKRNTKAEFITPFLNYKENGFKIELIGKEEVEGTETFKIKLTEHPVMKDGKEVSKEVYFYFDTENFVPIVAEEEIKEGQYKGMKVQQVFSDYQEVDGIYFPYSTMTKFNGMSGQEIKLESVKINPEVDNAMFQYKNTETVTPAKPKDKK